MRTILALSLFAAGCATDTVDALPLDQAAPSTLTHVAVGIEPGATASFVVDGAAPGELVRVLYSTRGQGVGPCPSVIGGQCMGIVAPLSNLGTARADTNGRAIINVDVPATAPIGASIATQAVVVRGVNGSDSLVSPALTHVAEIIDDDIGWQFTGLPQLGPDYVYENWLIVDDAPVSAGRYTVNGSGIPSSSLFTVTHDQVARSTAFIVTIEPATGDAPEPSETHILAGDMVNGVAMLNVAHPGALGTDFTAAAGAYFLQTPSSPEPNDFSQGIWFMDPAMGVGSLDLPTLPAGWEYEGWVVVGGTPYSTGRFVDPNAPDFDGGGPAAGPAGTPPVPGQDFIMPPLDLTGATVVISVEPQPDDSPAPFALKPLVDMTVDNMGPGVLEDLSNNAANTNPTGVAWFE